MAANNELVRKSLSRQEFEDLTRVSQDVFYFSNYIKLIHPIRGKVAFKLYPFQKKVLWDFLTKRFNIVLKFRQAGITELLSMYSLWLASYHNNKNVVIISIKDRVAKKVLKKMKFMYKNLPEHLKVSVVNGRSKDIGTATEIEFANGSMISSIPTTEDAGRSEAVSLLVIDEAAIVRWANTIWAAAFPTLSTGGGAIVNSTPYGVGNWFHGMWVEACAGGSSFNPIRLKWRMHPERDLSWYNEQREALGPRRTAQEIDGDFLNSGSSVFDLTDIKAIEDVLDQYQPIQTRFNGALRLFNPPEAGRRYAIGADISTGRSRDYSAFSIMDQHGEEVGCFKGKIPVDKFADLLMDMGKKYNNAKLAPETNDIGLAVTSHIQKAGYKNLYYSSKILREKGKRRTRTEAIPGWLTTRANRPVMIDELERDIRLNDINIKDPFFVQEAYTFIYDERNRPVAMGKNKRSGGGDDDLDDQIFTDDAIMAKCITNFVRKGKLKETIVLPQ
tara:strand:- start:406 stop:1908 length:1503 start_codon:yes stop_codon:yes gene_type:complete